MYWITALGACIGITTGLFGAGSSFLTVLLLIHAGGLAIGSAIPTALVVVAGMGLVGVVPYARAGAVVWRVATSFGLASMIGAWLGGHASTLIPARILHVIFLLTMVVAAVMMLWERPLPSSGGSPARERYAAVMAGGLLLGGLTGMVGLGGGFAVVPLLVVVARLPVRSAVGTSMLIIAMNTLAGLAGHLPHLSVDWRIAAYLVAAEAAGSLAGAQLGKRIGGKALRRGFAGLMLVTAVPLLVSAVLR